MRAGNEDGYELWLRYRKVDSAARLAQYRDAIQSVVVLDASPTAEIIKSECARALPALLDMPAPIVEGRSGMRGGRCPPAIRRTWAPPDEGFQIRSHQEEGHNRISITGNSEPAILTGVFHFLRLLQTHQDICCLDLMSRPRIRHRILAHWDNLGGSIERGYAGQSLWNWDELPAKIDPRYHDYARACASVGINGACLTNVNAGARSLSAEYLEKTAALADVFRPYGLRVYLSPVFSAPIRLGGLATSDPRDAAVAAWWQRKVDEIYRLIPDFGGFQVKANSEGRPGPQDYGANHDDGANMLADALAPHGGIVLWRAFVYDVTVDPDRAKCAYKEFVPLDGRFRRTFWCKRRTVRLTSSRASRFIPSLAPCGRRPWRWSCRSLRNISASRSTWFTWAGCGRKCWTRTRMPRGRAQRSPRSWTARCTTTLHHASSASPTPARIATGAAIISPRPTGMPSAAWPGITG